MKHKIDPLIDPVFKAIFTRPENKNLLIHFLNAVLDLDVPVVKVTIEDPHNQISRLGDKLTILDVRATDQAERSFQIEVQIAIHPGLTGRMVFTWAELLTRQLKEGEKYPDLKPAIAIWLMAGTLFKEAPGFHHYLTMNDEKTGVGIEKESGIHVLELPKWAEAGQNEPDELGRWLRFFKEGENLDPEHLPEFMRTPEMEQAMSTVKQFSEDEKAYQRYRHARDQRRYSDTVHYERDMAVKERDEAVENLKNGELLRIEAQAESQKAQAECERAQERAQAAEAELEKMRQLLREKGNEAT